MSAPETWLVDAFNVLQVTLLGGENREGFWRAEMRGRLIEHAERFPPELGPVWLVFDGPRPEPALEHAEDPAAPLHVVYTPSADEWIHRRAKDLVSAGSACVVVSADKPLAGRARHAGARIVPPGEFVAACRSAEAIDEANPRPRPGESP